GGDRRARAPRRDASRARSRIRGAHRTAGALASRDGTVRHRRDARRLARGPAARRRIPLRVAGRPGRRVRPAARDRTRRMQSGHRPSGRCVGRRLAVLSPQRRSVVSESWENHYLETLGNVPEAIRQLFDLDPEVATAYTAIRKRAYASEEGHVPLKYRELIF